MAEDGAAGVATAVMTMTIEKGDVHRARGRNASRPKARASLCHGRLRDVHGAEADGTADFHRRISFARIRKRRYLARTH
jgi:hypothetical protein